MSYKKAGVILAIVILALVLVLYSIFGITVAPKDSVQSKEGVSTVSSSNEPEVENISNPQESTIEESSSEEVSNGSTESSKPVEPAESAVQSSESVSEVDITSPMTMFDILSAEKSGKLNNVMVELKDGDIRGKYKDKEVVGLIASKHMYYYNGQVFYLLRIISSNGNYYDYFVPESAYFNLNSQDSMTLRVREYTINNEIINIVLSAQSGTPDNQ